LLIKFRIREESEVEHLQNFCQIRFHHCSCGSTSGSSAKIDRHIASMSENQTQNSFSKL
jgi:hypothetical protein